MIPKFDCKSDRVKGLSFHPTRPWLLVSLHSGSIQLWDYRICSLIDVFEEHEVPVRCISFHLTQPLFVSGADDYKIKGWNYKQRKCIFTLKNHLDYIRTVEFHAELPWLLSASDDQTIRIWNYQSRTLLHILTGHSHYVMAAHFHPTDDLIVSCSLDMQIRVWDFYWLKKRFTSSSYSSIKPGQGISNADVEVKAVLEGHDRGVNWCNFHPTEKLIISGADDNKVKIWKYNDSGNKTTDLDTLYGHKGNVSCVAFTRNNLAISDSEDKTVKVWDLKTRMCIHTVKRENERFWILATHPEDQNVIAVGHDAGFIVYHLKKLRVPYVSHNNTLFFVKDKVLCSFDMEANRSGSSIPLDYNEVSPLDKCPVELSYNTFDNEKHVVMVFVQSEKDEYNKIQIFIFEKNLTTDSNSPKRFKYCKGAQFIGKHSLICIEDVGPINYDYEKNTWKELSGLPIVKGVYPSNIGKFIGKNEEMVYLYDVTNRKMLGSFIGSDSLHLKLVSWNSNLHYLAITIKKNLIILNKQFQRISYNKEKFSIKSLVWTADNILLYSTKNHIKYMLPNGDNGILKCITKPIYLLRFSQNKLSTLDMSGEISSLEIDLNEAKFKNALFKKDPNQNYSGIALQLVTDKEARFSLAIDSGNLEIAFKIASELKDVNCYAKLGEEALRQGNQNLVEFSYKYTNSFEKLNFLYILLGQIDKQRRLLSFAQTKNDFGARLNLAMSLGEQKEKIKVLAETGQLPLAYLSACVHGFEDLAAPLKDSVSEFEENIKISLKNLNPKPKALTPLRPLNAHSEKEILKWAWPQIEIENEEFIFFANQQDDANAIVETKNPLDFEHQNLEEETEKEAEEFKSLNESAGQIDLDGGEWDIEDDLDLPENDKKNEVQQGNTIQSSSSNMIIPRKTAAQENARYSNSPSQMIAAGMIEEGLELLKKKIGLVDPEPLKEILGSSFAFSNLLASNIPFCSALIFGFQKEKIPALPISLQSLENDLKAGYKLMTEGKFPEANDAFKKILRTTILVEASSPKEKEFITDVRKISMEYALAIKCELTKRAQKAEGSRALELCSYMTIFNLQPIHRILTLRSAMSLNYKAKNFKLASAFAKKIIDIAENFPNSTKPEVVNNAKKVFAAGEQTSTNVVPIEFDENLLNDRFAFKKICAKSLTIIDPDYSVQAWDGSCYKAEFKGALAEICGICKIGHKCEGI